MMHCFRRNGLGAISIVFTWLFYSTACRGQSNDFQIGARGGLSFSPGIKRFEQVEAFGDWKLPYRWHIANSDLVLRPYLDLSMGGIWNEKTDGIVGTLGPGVELHFGQFPVVLEGGINPTVLSLDNFGGENFGYKVQFTSHIGLRWEITKHGDVLGGLYFLSGSSYLMDEA
jgi:hypothetical protein